MIDPRRGLTDAQVAERVEAGLVNDLPDAPSRTVPQILRANVLTRFNALMGFLLGVVLACGAYKDALFGGVIVANSLIGIVQEVRAKRILDKLTVLSEPEAHLVRNGQVRSADVREIVLDDICELRPGGQICADGVVVSAEGLEVDESLLTGEADPVVKETGDELMSGSFVVSGAGREQVTRVGADAYAAKLAEQARKFTLVNSELRDSIGRIVTFVSIALVPVGIALFITQQRETHDLRTALVKTVGGVVAMVPEGLVLLVSVAFAVGVVRLARRRTLVQELPAIETLARVDVLCLDKTGTITEGTMSVAGLDPLHHDDTDGSRARAGIAAVAWSEPNPNATQQALRDAFADPPANWTSVAVTPFSSARKWSSASFAGEGTWVVGAPEMVLSGDSWTAIAARVEAEAGSGRRVLAVAHSPSEDPDGQLPDDITAVGLVALEDTIRHDASETLAYFAAEGVTLKVISGDNPITVGAVAARAGLSGADRIVDARTLPDENEALADAVEAATVFGRVAPNQKQSMVEALQSRGHIVAMTGDGVNDVLALKNADVGIAMASGSEASRAVAQVVLLDSNFSALPAVLAEGRKVINNLSRAAALYLTKTTWALIINLVTSVTSSRYPFLPRQITIVSTGIIGIPSLFLALAPNTERVRGHFVRRVLATAVPCGLSISATVMTAYLIAHDRPDLTDIQESTVATIVLIAMSVGVLVITARPLAGWKLALILVTGTVVALAVVTPWGRDYFELALPGTAMLEITALVAGAGLVAMFLVEPISRRRFAPD